MNNRGLSRRDFLKILSMIPVSASIAPLSKLSPSADKNQPHVIVIVYDAWSARNTSLYGYPRQTMPNLEKFAEKAVVYHQHYSNGNWTSPGTASLLTGTYPWNHRALSFGGQISPVYKEKQIFNLLSDTHTTIGFAQNKNADIFLYQSGSGLKKHISTSAYNLNSNLTYTLPFFKKDAYLAKSSIDELILLTNGGFLGSMFFGPIYNAWSLYSRIIAESQNKGKYYDDLLPDNDEQFLLSSIVDGAIDTLKNLKEPSLVYFHFYPPHAPYRPTDKTNKLFEKGPETLTRKPIHPLSVKKYDYRVLKSGNLRYDKYLSTWDAEVARLYQYIDQSGLRDNSVLFLTSDHGDMFERGELHHWTPLLNQPITHVPLLVTYPGLTKRIDVHSTTSGVDILPTIARLTNKPQPGWSDGQILPGFSDQIDPDHSVFHLDSKQNANFAPLTKFSLGLTKDKKRLLYYHYEDYQSFEFFDLNTDPEELTDLYPTHSAEVTAMEQELLQKVAEISAPIP